MCDMKSVGHAGSCCKKGSESQVKTVGFLEEALRVHCRLRQVEFRFVLCLQQSNLEISDLVNEGSAQGSSLGRESQEVATTTSCICWIRTRGE